MFKRKIVFPVQFIYKLIGCIFVFALASGLWASGALLTWQGAMPQSGIALAAGGYFDRLLFTDAFPGGGQSQGAVQDVGVMNADCTGRIPLTFWKIAYRAGDLTGGDMEWNPTWSPDTQRIAFTWNYDRVMSLFVMNADGSGVIRLTDFDSNDPDWRPEQSSVPAPAIKAPAASAVGGVINKIVFWGSRSKLNEAPNIFNIQPDGTNLQKLTETKAPWGSYCPSWSPDATTIAFYSTRAGGRPELYLMDAAGGNEKLLVNKVRIDLAYGCPAWSPDGQKIAFLAQSEAGDTDLMIVNRDGKDLQQLTSGPDTDWEPVWQPYTNRILFVSNRDGTSGGDYRLFSIQPDGSDLQPVGDGKCSARGPDFAPLFQRMP